MVLIDRSVSGGEEKRYIGSSKTKLSISSDYEAQTYNRLNGYRKHVDGENVCFARFTTNEINKTERRAEIPLERTQHTRTSKAVAKKHVITEEILSRANQFFEADDVFLTDMCKQTMIESAEDEDEETEVSENVTEEMVMLRQRDESQVIRYTPENEKKTRPKVTGENLIKRIKATGRFGTIGAAFQNMIDLFSIEIPVKYLEAVRFRTIIQKNFFRHRVLVSLFWGTIDFFDFVWIFFQESKFLLALIPAQQDRLIGGKSFDEIIATAKNATVRRQHKYKFALFSSQLQKLIDEFENVYYQPNLLIDIGAVKIYGVKRTDSRIDSEIVQKHVADFFREFTKYRVNDDLLLQRFNNFYSKMNEKYKTMFEHFNDQIDWTDKISYTSYFNLLQASLQEKERNDKDNFDND